MDTVECPYCGKESEINHEDGYGYREDMTYNQECEHCEKTFIYTTSISYYYEADKAPCLNGGEHKWRHRFPQYLWTERPEFKNRVECDVCDKTDTLTDEQINQIQT